MLRYSNISETGPKNNLPRSHAKGRDDTGVYNQKIHKVGRDFNQNRQSGRLYHSGLLNKAISIFLDKLVFVSVFLDKAAFISVFLNK